MSLSRYAEYKDSGVEWLGEVPMGWRVDRLKASITSCRNGIWGGDPTGDDDDIECVRVADFDRARLVVDDDVPTLRSVTAKERADRLVTAGDLLLEKSGGGEKQPVGQVVLYDRPAQAVCSNFVAKVTLASGMVPRFWMYQHAAAYARGVNVGSIKQTSGIQNLDQSQYFNERGVFPSEQEQSTIATFLDRETGKIDALIAEQEKLLTLLAEKRQATISHAVTRGLNPNTSMKDSSVPWLGEVPAHWQITSLGRTSISRCDGPFGSGIKSDHYTDKGALVVRLQNIRAYAFNIGEPVYLHQEYFETSLRGHEVVGGDLLVAGLGDEKNLLGRACVAPEGLGAALVKADCFRFRLREDQAMPHFVAMQLSAGAAFDAGVMATGTTRSRMPLGVMSSRKVVLPSVPEQSEIIAFVDAKLGQFDALRKEAEAGIELLKERRSALIAVAVTGKIDVRGAIEAPIA